MKTHIRIVITTLVLVILVAGLPLAAQEGSEHTVVYDRFSFTFSETLADSVNVMQVPGDPVQGAGPGFSDAAKTQFTLYTYGEPTDSLFDTGGVRFYQMSDVEQYDFLLVQAEQLQALLAEKPDLAQFELAINNPDVGGLPYVPVLTHGQNLTARAQYVETEALEGINYVAAYRADFGPYLSTDFLYTFQGISKDGRYYVNATFPLATELFPETLAAISYNPEAFQAEWDSYLAETIETLNTADDGEFSPSLEMLDDVVQSIGFGSRP